MNPFGCAISSAFNRGMTTITSNGKLIAGRQAATLAFSTRQAGYFLYYSYVYEEQVQKYKGSFSGLFAMSYEGLIRPMLRFAPLALAWDRGAHAQDLTKNIQFISKENTKITTDPKTMKMDIISNKPRCIMITWLLARQKHVMKYANLYLEQGYDVVSVSCTPWQLLWPTKGSQLVAGDLLKFMAANDNEQPTVLHGFSVGGYMWGEVCAHIVQNKQTYQPVLDRIVAQVWDSAADVSEITVGVPAAVFPKNKIMKTTLKAYMEYHMKTFYNVATVHYIRSSQLFHTNLCRAPALFVLSKSDPVGSEKSNRAVYDSWVKNGMKCTWQCWERSPHVQHYTKHREEYEALLYRHLRENVPQIRAQQTRAHA